MRDATNDGYSLPPDNRLHYVLVKMSSRTYCVAEYNGKFAFPPTDVIPSLPTEAGCQMWQHGFSFEIVSKPMSYEKAVDLVAYLIAKRLTTRPILFDGESK